MNPLDYIPKGVFAVLTAVLLATSCKLKVDNSGLSLEIEKHATHIANLETSIARGNEQAAAQTALFTQQARAAEQARTVREKALLADASRAYDELDRMQRILSRETAGVYGLRSPSSSFAPDLDYPDALPELLSECSRRYVEVAGKADGHASDAQTLIDAWPKQSEKQIRDDSEHRQ